jgi:hypothetical protein
MHAKRLDIHAGAKNAQQPSPSGLDETPCSAEFAVEINKDWRSKDTRMWKEFEFRTNDELADAPLALMLGYEIAAQESWQTVEVKIKRLDDPDAENVLPTLEEVRKLLLPNANVDLPDTAAQDSDSKSNNPAVSG